MSTLKYKRVLLKLSGEALAEGGDGLYNYGFVDTVASKIKKSMDMGAQIAVVCGGGNIWRGRQGGKMDRVRADRMGMLATVMNAIALQDAFIAAGMDAVIMTAVPIQGVGQAYNRDEAIRHLENGKIVIFGAGTGSPYFTTDTTALLRAAEINADASLFAKNIDGVYTADPKKDPSAVKLDNITYDRIISERLGVIDLTAATFGLENKMTVLLFGLSDPENIVRAVSGENIGTLLTV
ncbi:MAG: UMP kinase [Clostridia bacterium]|nr:UMP kinase [Clostridia bacterium]